MCSNFIQAKNSHIKAINKGTKARKPTNGIISQTMPIKSNTKDTKNNPHRLNLIIPYKA